MADKKVIAITVSDLHLSHKAPPIRDTKAEPWYDCMRRYLTQLYKLQMEYGECPVIIAGDLFDKWNAPPELINFAMRELPSDPIYAIPGQHDLRFHHYADLGCTAFGTLVEADRIRLIEPLKPKHTTKGKISLYGFPWGEEVTPNPKKISGYIPLAVIHSYIWTKNHGYAGAPETGLTKNWKSRLEGYTAAVFGDNHSGFQKGKIFNHGTFMIRRADELDYKPIVGLLFDDGSMEPHYLDTSGDRFLDRELIKVMGDELFGLNEFMEQLGSLRDSVYDFREAVERFLGVQNAPDQVKRIVMKALEGDVK